MTVFEGFYKRGLKLDKREYHFNFETMVISGEGVLIEGIKIDSKQV